MFNSTGIKIFRELGEPISISALAKRLGLHHSTVSIAVSALEEDGLVARYREGNHVYVKRSDTLHSHALKNLLMEFPRLPVEDVFTSSGMQILGVLTAPHNVTDISSMTGLNRLTVSAAVKEMSKHGLVLKKGTKYASNPKHRHAGSFVTNYWEYTANITLRHISKDAILIWQRGDEFLFKSRTKLNSADNDKNIHLTAVSVFPAHGLGMISDMRYYFYTSRRLKVEDNIIHTILIEPSSSIYNSYALALYSRSKSKDLVKYSSYYDLEDHVNLLLDYLETKEAKTNFLLPWNEYQDILASME